MKTKKPATPRRDHRKERAEALERQYREWTEDREKIHAESVRLQEAAVRVYRLLEAERNELLARAGKILATMKALELRIESLGSPVSTSIDGWT